MGFIHFKWPQMELNYVIPSRSSIEHFEDPILDSNPSCKLQRCFYSSHIESFCLVFTSVTSAIFHWFLPHTEWILVRHRVNQQTQAGDTNINYIQTITVTFN